jgi:hypothetical protein
VRDLIAWAPLGLLWASRLDMILIWRGAWLSIAWVTGRALQFGPEMHVVERFLREQINVAAQVGALAAVIWWWWSWGHELPTVPKLSQLSWRRRPKQTKNTAATPTG